MLCFQGKQMNRVERQAMCGSCSCRRAFELAFATSYLFAGSRPTFTQVGEITFKRAVEVGDLLRLHSTVLYTHEDGSTGRVGPAIFSFTSDSCLDHVAERLPGL